MAYTTIREGSRGEDVKRLQTLLNNEGYSLDVDGIFGEKTQSAVRQYQRNQGLDVDGIVGANTLERALQPRGGAGFCAANAHGTGGRVGRPGSHRRFERADCLLWEPERLG